MQLEDVFCKTEARVNYGTIGTGNNKKTGNFTISNENSTFFWKFLLTNMFAGAIISVVIGISLLM